MSIQVIKIMTREPSCKQSDKIPTCGREGYGAGPQSCP